MRKFTTALGLAAALVAGTASVVTIAPFFPTVDGDAQLIGCNDIDSTNGALSIAESRRLNSDTPQASRCPQTKLQEGLIASV